MLQQLYDATMRKYRPRSFPSLSLSSSLSKSSSLPLFFSQLFDSPSLPSSLPPSISIPAIPLSLSPVLSLSLMERAERWRPRASNAPFSADRDRYQSRKEDLRFQNIVKDRESLISLSRFQIVSHSPAIFQYYLSVPLHLIVPTNCIALVTPSLMMIP